jgi:hypothetical protein
MNKKERRLALATALQSAAQDMIVVEHLEEQVQDMKTKTLLSILNKVSRQLQGGYAYTAFCITQPYIACAHRHCFGS